MIFEAIKRTYTILDTLYLNEYSTIKLSNAFCALCEVHNYYPKEFLEHFTGRISAANAHAHKGLNLAYDNYTFSFFSNIADDFGSDTADGFKLTDVEFDFYGKMGELHIGLYTVRDLQERTTI